MPTKVNLPDGRVVHFPDGMSPSDIEQALGEVHAPTAATAKPTATAGRGGPYQALVGPIWDTVKAHPVEAGAIAGGALAAPLTGGASMLPAWASATAAAAAGGAGGAGVGLIAKAARGDADTPNTAGGVLGEMGQQGALQAAAEGGGRMLQGTLRMIGNRLYQSVLKPTLKARNEFPQLVDTGLTQGVPVSSGGAIKAANLKMASMGKADQMVADAAAQPNAPMIDPRRAVSGIAPAVQNVRQLPVARPQLRAIGDYARSYLSEHPAPMSLPEAQSAVRATDRFFDPAYRATMDKGNPVTSGNVAAAMGINNETRGLLRAAVPGLQGQNANTQALMGLEQAIEQRAGQQANNSPVGMRHLINAGTASSIGLLSDKQHGAATWLAMEAATNPAIASRLAIGAARTSALPYAQLLRAAVLAKLSGADGSPEPR